MQFALSKARYEADDHEWECTDMLGRGGFGMVGQWSKVDARGRVLDVIAIKQVDLDGSDFDERGIVKIPKEAIFMRGLEQDGCRNVSQLRALKVFDGDRPKWRYYMEFYKYGTLGVLIENYQRHNRQHSRQLEERIPESFLWQAFHDFAQCLSYMRSTRFDNLAPVGREPFVLHLDLKHENVLLGAAPRDRSLINYPTVKVADWGVAAYTTIHDAKNSSRLKYHGTIRWHPPEQRDAGNYGAHWRNRILGGSNEPFTPAHTVFQIGANMFGMMFLDTYNGELDRLFAHYEDREGTLMRQGWSLFPYGLGTRHYSSALSDLVEDCLRLDPRRRPTVSQLLQRTADGLQPFTNSFRRTGRAEALRL